MDLGGLSHAKERVFLLSTTHGAETHSLAAAIETMRIYERENVIEYLHRQGERLRKASTGPSQAITLRVTLPYSVRSPIWSMPRVMQTRILRSPSERYSCRKPLSEAC